MMRATSRTCVMRSGASPSEAKAASVGFHPTMTSTGATKNPLVCETCGTSAKSKAGLSAHARSHK